MQPPLMLIPVLTLAAILLSLVIPQRGKLRNFDGIAWLGVLFSLLLPPLLQLQGSGWIPAGFAPLAPLLASQTDQPNLEHWLFGAAWLALAWLVFIQNSSGSWSGIAVLLTLLTSQCTILFAPVWSQWGAVALGSWACALGLVSSGSSRERGSGIGSVLLWLTAADLLWMIGLLTLADAGIGGRLDIITQPEFMAMVDPQQSGTVGLATMYLLPSLLIRGALFPLMVWTRRALQSERDVAWLTISAVFPALILIWRWAPLLTAIPQTRTLLQGLGLLSAILLTLIAWSRPELPHRLMRLIGSQVGWLMLGIACGLEAESLALTLGLGTALLGTSLALQFSQLGNGSGSPRPPALTTVFVWLCGLFGQEGVFLAIPEVMGEAGPARLLMPYVLLFAQGLAAFLLFRGEQAGRREILPSLPIDIGTRGHKLPTMWIVLTLVICVHWWWGIQPPEGMRVMMPLSCGLAVIIGWVASWTIPIRDTQEANPFGLSGSLKRIAREEFYVTQMVTAVFVLPIRLMAPMARFAEWILIERFTWKLPRSVVTGIAEETERLDEETRPRASAIHALMAAAVMIGAILIARRL